MQTLLHVQSVCVGEKIHISQQLPINLEVKNLLKFIHIHISALACMLNSMLMKCIVEYVALVTIAVLDRVLNVAGMVSHMYFLEQTLRVEYPIGGPYLQFSSGHISWRFQEKLQTELFIVLLPTASNTPQVPLVPFYTRDP